MESVKSILERAKQAEASDLFLIAGRGVSMKVNGVVSLEKEPEERLMPEDTEKLVRELYALADRSIDQYLKIGDDDFSVTLPGTGRFRVNTYRQRSSMAAVVRIVSFGIPDPKERSIPEDVMKLAKLKHGLVLVTGPAGNGKSTTLACLVDAINRDKDRRGHIITIEDPIEYLHQNRECIVSQRELSMDTQSYGAALRASLRQAPNVILLGEMRDLDTIQTAMTAAETGHLVFSTLHNLGAVNTIDRIIDVFPEGQQTQIRFQLAQVLKTVVSQQLLPTVDGGQAPAFEIMHMTTAIKTMVRDARTHQINGAMNSGPGPLDRNRDKDEEAVGRMIRMDDYILEELYRPGRITAETAVQYAMDRDQMKKKLGIR